MEEVAQALRLQWPTELPPFLSTPRTQDTQLSSVRFRSQITSKWIYPYEASSKGIEGELVIDFSIAKSGEVQSIELRKSSGVAILDEYAMRAVRLASPFPPVPDAISKGGLPIHGIFRYHRNGTVEPRGPTGK